MEKMNFQYELLEKKIRNPNQYREIKFGIMDEIQNGLIYINDVLEPQLVKLKENYDKMMTTEQLRKIENSYMMFRSSRIGEDFQNQIMELDKSLRKNADIFTIANQIKKILDLCEYDTDKTMSEVEKLLLYKMDSKSISDSDIDDVVVRSTDKELYSFNECVLNRKIGEAFDSLKILLNNNIDSIIIIDSLARQYRLLYQMKVLHEEMSYDDMARSLGINSFVIKKSHSFCISSSLSTSW